MLDDDDDPINDLIDDAINQLADDSINAGVDCLVELAKLFANAGCTLQAFADIRKYIIEQAIERTNIIFIQTKIELAETLMRNRRNGNRKIITH